MKIQLLRLKSGNNVLGVLFFVLIVYMIIGCESQVSETQNTGKETTEYDSLLAKKLKADNYGMHQYVIAFLKKGPNRTQDSAKAMDLQRAHLDNINRLAQNGSLVLAGPFLDTGVLRGIYIFDVKTIEEAKALTESDPAIQAGSLEMELKPWYGSAALLQVNDIHSKIAKESP